MINKIISSVLKLFKTSSVAQSPEISSHQKKEPIDIMQPVPIIESKKIEPKPIAKYSKEKNIELIIKDCREKGFLNSQISYVLATVEWETAKTFQPVYEAYYLGSRAKAYLKKLRYYPFYGRGFVQLTWERNYKIYSQKLNIDLVSNPDLAMDADYSRFILIDGFKVGAFTGKKISDFIKTNAPTFADFMNARRCINGKDRAKEIAQLAVNWQKKLLIKG